MLAVVTCFFNPSESANSIANYFRFRQAIKMVPIFTVEMSFTGHFVIPDSIRINGCLETQVLWQKERILNHGISYIPDCFDQIAWLDCDLLFTNPDWPAITEKLLEAFPVVQLFEQCHWLNQYCEIEKSRPSSASLGSYFQTGTDKSHPGFAWAARREQISQWGGLFDQDITGSGDAWMTHAFFSEFETSMAREASPKLRNAALNWCQRVSSTTGGKVGVVAGAVLHLYHGDLQERKYWERFLLLKEHNYDPNADIEIAENGAWKWASSKIDLHHDVRKQFGNIGNFNETQ